MDEETKRQMCRMIAGLVASDAEFNDHEREFVEKVQVQFGIPESDWDAIFPLVESDEATQIMAGFDQATQQTGFELLLQAAFADSHIVVEEAAYIASVGKAIGMTDDEVQQRLDSGKS